MSTPAQGEIWWAELPDAGRRPTLVMTRDAAIPVLRTIVVAPVTRTIRDIPTEIPLGPDQGLSTQSVASVDNVQPIPRWALTERIGSLGLSARSRICAALGAMADC